jgi:hypothetical protein
MEVTNVGFFRELPHGDPTGPSLRDALGRGDAGVRDQIASYLASGAVLATTSARASDVLRDTKVDAGRLAILTDGRWVWPADLPYYVREYNIQLPANLVEWARSAGWVPRDVSTEELVRIEEQLFAEDQSG